MVELTREEIETILDLIEFYGCGDLTEDKLEDKLRKALEEKKN